MPRFHDWREVNIGFVLGKLVVGADVLPHKQELSHLHPYSDLLQTLSFECLR